MTSTKDVLKLEAVTCENCGAAPTSIMELTEIKHFGKCSVCLVDEVMYAD